MLSENHDASAELLDAALAGDADRVAAALQNGADIETRDDHERTALLLAATHDHVGVARVLIANGADPNALDDRHDTPWLVTGVTGSVAMLEALLPAKPDLTIRNRFGGVAVIPASHRGHVDYVRRVVQTDIDINHVNDPGWTALLEADPNIADLEGVTPLEHARARGYDAIVSILTPP